MNINDIKNKLIQKNLRVTPQRIAILEAVIKLKNHPTVEKIIEFIKNRYPNIAVGTVYKTLDVFVNKGLLQRVKTDDDIKRYDAISDNHHHLYCQKSDRIEDFYDAKLNRIIDKYFSKRKIPNFEIKNIRLQIVGNFKNKNI